jgi:hypothetical protein
MPIYRFKIPECALIRIPKTGSTSIVRGMLGGGKNVSEIVRGYYPKEWEGIFTFALVRNPFDRLISAYHMFKEISVSTDEEEEMKNNLRLDSMLDIVEDDSIAVIPADYLSTLRLHSIPMTSPYFCMEHADYIGRYEQFTEEYRKIAIRLGIQIYEIPHFRKTTRQHYSQYFTIRLRERVEEIFKHDFSTFGYSFN